MSEAKLLILEILGGREMYGLDIVAESGGKLGRAIIYVHLSWLEENGYVTRREEDAPKYPGALPRSLYRAIGKRPAPEGFGEWVTV